MQFISENTDCVAPRQAAAMLAREQPTKKSTNDLCLFVGGLHAIVALLV